MNTYYKGQKVRCSVAFTVDEVATDPTTVIFKVRKPDGVETTYTYGVDLIVVKDDTGQYHADFSTSLAGNWLMRWEGTGTCEAVDEDLAYIETIFT